MSYVSGGVMDVSSDVMYVSSDVRHVSSGVRYVSSGVMDGSCGTYRCGTRQSIGMRMSGSSSSKCFRFLFVP